MTLFFSNIPKEVLEMLALNLFGFLTLSCLFETKKVIVKKIKEKNKRKKDFEKNKNKC